MYEATVRVPNAVRCARVSEGRCTLLCADSSMTDPQFLLSSDINSILSHFRKTGLLPQRGGSPVPFDLQTRPDLNDFQSVLEYVEDLRSRRAGSSSALQNSNPKVDDLSADASSVDGSQSAESRQTETPSAAESVTDGTPNA